MYSNRTVGDMMGKQLTISEMLERDRKVKEQIQIDQIQRSNINPSRATINDKRLHNSKYNYLEGLFDETISYAEAVDMLNQGQVEEFDVKNSIISLIGKNGITYTFEGRYDPVTNQIFPF